MKKMKIIIIMLSILMVLGLTGCDEIPGLVTPTPAPIAEGPTPSATTSPTINPTPSPTLDIPTPSIDNTQGDAEEFTPSEFCMNFWDKMKPDWKDRMKSQKAVEDLKDFTIKVNGKTIVGPPKEEKVTDERQPTPSPTLDPEKFIIHDVYKDTQISVCPDNHIHIEKGEVVISLSNSKKTDLKYEVSYTTLGGKFQTVQSSNSSFTIIVTEPILIDIFMAFDIHSGAYDNGLTVCFVLCPYCK